MNEEETVKRIETMKYKVGDKVRIKSLDWYNENKNKYGEIRVGDGYWNKQIKDFCSSIMTIYRIVDNKWYMMEETFGTAMWTDEMIEGLAEEEIKVGTVLNPIELKSNANCLTQEKVDETKSEPKFKVGEIVYSKTWQRDVIILDILPDGVYKVGDKHGLGWFKENEDNLLNEKNTLPTDSQPFKQEISLPEGYIFKDENGNVINAKKIVLEKKKKEYPKTYEECLSVLKIKGYDIVTYVPSWTAYEKALYQKVLKLRELVICRDAYWELYGEEIGLGKPWEADWVNLEQNKHCIWVDVGDIILNEGYRCQHILTFPTAEMRDAFYENFKELIEQCKELL